MPDGTQIPQEPNLITFPQHKYPPQNEIRTAIYSTESLSVPVVDAVYALQTRFKDFAGADFPLSFYNPGDDSPEIPDFIQMLSGTNAILPKSLIKESISFIEIATYYTLAGKLYDLVNSDNSRFQGDAEIAKYKFNDIFKDFVNKYNGQVPTRGLYPDGTDINQENDRVAVALKACDIASYLNDSDRGKFYFGEIRNDPRAFFASTLTVFNFFADKFKMAKNDEYKTGKQISGDIEKICRPVYTLLRSINGNLDAQSKLVKGLPETGLVSYQFS
jgi:hypothetical protein